jgi:hypothetical protein
MRASIVRSAAAALTVAAIAPGSPAFAKGRGNSSAVHSSAPAPAIHSMQPKPASGYRIPVVKNYRTPTGKDGFVWVKGKGDVPGH